MQRCWCGADELVAFSGDYAWCTACGTLVGLRRPDPSVHGVADDERDFYGKHYYETYLTTQHGYLSLADRARDDLATRCVHWARTLMRHRLPPGRVLEVGCAHGAFVALLRQAGFRACGLEMSPAVIRFARQTFGIPVLRGPIEQHRIRSASLDAIVLLDVIEHLPDPVGTLAHCVGLLKPGGVLLIQTPEFPEVDRAALEASGARFIEQLKPDEHVFLFSSRSIRALMTRIGATSVLFEPASFAHYDMFLAAGREPLSPLDDAEMARALEASASGRMVQALLAVDAHRLAARADDAAARADVEYLKALASGREGERDAARREAADVRQTLGFRTAERDAVSAELVAVRLELRNAREAAEARVQALDQERRWLADRRAALEREALELREANDGLLDVRDVLERHVADLRDDRASLLDARDALERHAHSLAGESTRLRALLREREEHVAQIAARSEYFRDAAATLEAALGAERTSADHSQTRWLDTVARLRELVAHSAGAHRSLRASRAYRLLRLLGRWPEYDRMATELDGADVAQPPLTASRWAPHGFADAPPAPGPLSPLPAEPPAPGPMPPLHDESAWPTVPVTMPEAPSADAYPARLVSRLTALDLWAPEWFDRWERHGFHLTADHFYSPIPNVAALAGGAWPPPAGLQGVDMREEAQLALLERCRAFGPELADFPVAPPATPYTYYRDNAMFRVVDADVLHCLVCSGRPRRVLDIGSGFSTLLTAAALGRNAAEGHPGECVAVEPFPSGVLKAGIPGLDQLRVEGVQSLPRNYFDRLDRGDILFIDSSHVSKTGSDVNRLFLDVLPRLRPGVLVHVHDVFLPAEYPREWVVDEHRFWNEQYLLHAFLLFNGAFEIVWASSFMHLTHPERLREVFPAYDPATAWPGSFWMRRKDA